MHIIVATFTLLTALTQVNGAHMYTPAERAQTLPAAEPLPHSSVRGHFRTVSAMITETTASQPIEDNQWRISNPLVAKNSEIRAPRGTPLPAITAASANCATPVAPYPSAWL